MKKIYYSPDALEKMQRLKTSLSLEYGEKTANKIIRKMTAAIRSLQQYEEKGIALRDFYDVDTDYRKLYTEHNHVFYRIEDDQIKIVDIYHEREDFLCRLFGIITVNPEDERYWDDIENDM